eukprot:Gb_37810 [translate_table: standard]
MVVLLHLLGSCFLIQIFDMIIKGSLKFICLRSLPKTYSNKSMPWATTIVLLNAQHKISAAVNYRLHWNWLAPSHKCLGIQLASVPILKLDDAFLPFADNPQCPLPCPLVDIPLISPI